MPVKNKLSSKKDRTKKISGKVSTPQGWVDVEKVVFAPPNPTNKQTKNWSASLQQVEYITHKRRKKTCSDQNSIF